MALTDAQKLSVYECLGVTHGAGGGTNEDNATIHNGFGVTLTLTEMDTLRDALAAHLAGITAAVETKIAAIVVKWDEVAYCAGKIEGGTVGDISGVTVSFDEIRAVLRDRMMNVLPVMHMVDSIKKRQGPPDHRQMFVGVSR